METYKSAGTTNSEKYLAKLCQTRLQQRDFASCSPTIGYGGTSAAWHHALFSIGGVSFYSSIFCTLGGIATPTARKTAAVVSARSLRRRNRFP